MGKTLKSHQILKETLELSWKSQGINSYQKCSTATLLSLFHSDTVTIVPQWHSSDCFTVTLLRCSTVTLLRLFHSETVAIVPQWHCYDCSTLARLRLFHSDSVTILPQWHCYTCATVMPVQLFHSDTVRIVPQCHCCYCFTVTLLRLFHSKSFEIKVLWTVNSEIHYRRITCTRNTIHDPDQDLNKAFWFNKVRQICL